jgi:hypothetical protein
MDKPYIATATRYPLAQSEPCDTLADAISWLVYQRPPHEWMIEHDGEMIARGDQRGAMDVPEGWHSA